MGVESSSAAQSGLPSFKLNHCSRGELPQGKSQVVNPGSRSANPAGGQTDTPMGWCPVRPAREWSSVQLSKSQVRATAPIGA